MWPDMADADNGLVCPAISGNYASLADGSNVQFGTTSLELCFRAQINDWTPNTARFLAVKSNGFFAPSLYISSATGVLVYQCRIGGVNRNIAAAVAPTISDGEWAWLRVTHTFATGKVNFYYAADSESIPTSWTQVGTEQTTATGAPTDAVSTFGIGGNSGLNTLDGTIKRFLYYKDGAISVDADFSAQAKGTTSFTESSSNAATVTVNQSGALPAHIGNAKDLLQGTGTNQPAYSAGVITFDGADNYLKTNAFTLNQPTTVYFVGNPVSWTNGDVIFGSQSGTTAYVRQDTSTPQIEAYAGTASTNDSNFAVGSYAVLSVVFNGANSVLQINNNSAVTGDFGAGVLGGLTLGAAATPASYFNGAFKECVVFAAAHDATQRASVIAALNTLNTVF